MVDIKNVFKHAILNNAANIICFHNHVSGHARPSKEDRQVTKQLSDAGKMLGIGLVDHIIIGDGKYYSLKQEEQIRDLKYKAPAA